MTKHKRLLHAVSIAMIMTMLLTMGAGALAAEGQEEPVTLFVATDLHYISPELTDHGDFYQRMIRSGDGKAMEYCEELTEVLVEQVIDQQPDALILSGDLTFNGAELSHAALVEKLRRIEDAGVPVLAIPGNHDLENRMAASFQGDGYAFVDSIDARRYAELYRDFGLDEAIAKDDASLSYVAQVTPALWVLMLDVNADGSGALNEQTFQWVERQLQEAELQGARVIAVSHQNLLVHNDLFIYGYVIGNRIGLQRLYEQYGVICSLSGHIHMQHTTRSNKDLPEIVTSSLMVWPNQYGVLTLDGQQGQYHTVSVAEAAGLADETHAFFWDTAYGQALSALGEDGDEAMARFFADVNTSYFAGRTDTLSWDETLAQGWADSRLRFSAYIQSVLDEGLKNHTEYSFPLTGQETEQAAAAAP